MTSTNITEWELCVVINNKLSVEVIQFSLTVTVNQTVTIKWTQNLINTTYFIIAPF